MQIKVWVDDWQMQCCGKPFAVGQRVSWSLTDAADDERLEQVLGPDLARQVDFCEEHHGGLPDNTLATRGVVLAIGAVRCRFTEVPGRSNVLHPARGTGEVTAVTRADGSEEKAPELRFVGYLVDLDVPGSRPVTA